MALLKETPDNIDQLLKKAALTNDWKARLLALNELKKYDCPQSRDVISRLALYDKVYKIKEEAFKAAKALGIEKNGKPIKLGKKNIGYKLKDFIEIFLKIKKDKQMDNLDLTVFKKTLKIINPEMYNVMEFEKSKKFDSWIRTSYNCLPKE